jgi:hypothetical protein
MRDTKPDPIFGKRESVRMRRRAIDREDREDREGEKDRKGEKERER